MLVLGKLIQIDNRLTCKSNNIGYAHSSDLYLEVEFTDTYFKQDECFIGFACSLDIAGEKVISLNYDPTTKLVKLSKEFFNGQGIKCISLYSVTKDGATVTSSLAKVNVGNSNRLEFDNININESTIIQIKNIVDQYIDKFVVPKVIELTEEAKKQQEEAKKQQEAVNTLVLETKEMIAAGELDGRTIFNGIGLPDPTQGRDGDTYINRSNEGEYAQYFFIKIDGIWEPQFKVAGKDGTDTLPVGAEVLIDYDQPIPVGYEEVEETYEAAEVYLENGKTVEESMSTIDLDGTVQPTLSMSTTRDSTKEKVKVQLTDSSGKAIMIETSADQVYVNDDIKLSDVLNGQAFYIKQEDGFLYLGNYAEWVDAGKPSMLQGE